MLNTEQESARGKVLEWWHNSLCPFFFLLGDAGTGKTFTLSRILESLDISPSKILALAPSHKAKRIMSSFFREVGMGAIQCRTIHSALGMKMNFDAIEGRNKLSKSSLQKIEENFLNKSLIIIDEISMLGENLVEGIKVVRSMFDVKFLLLGDLKQLPPIQNEKKMRVEDKGTFPILEFLEVENVARLTQVMRYDNPELSQIINASKICIQNEIGFSLPLKKPDSPSIQIIDRSEAEKRIKDYLHYGCRADFVCLGYKNATMDDLAGTLRQEVYATHEPYLVGETFYANTALYETQWGICESTPSISNNSVFRIIGIEEKQEEFYFDDEKEILDFYSIDIELIDGLCLDDSIKCITAFKAKKAIENMKKSLSIKAGKAKKKGDYNRAKKLNAQKWTLQKRHSIIKPIWVSSIHKSQGSSYDEVFLFDDIQKPKGYQKNKGIAEHNFNFLQPRLWYVGMSRAKKTLFIVEG